MNHLYVASSWRNKYYPIVLAHLRAAGYGVYDFRQPTPEETGFRWIDIAGPNPCDAKQLASALAHPRAKSAFASDYDGMEHARACVLVLPCGRSAHMEVGWFTGRGRPVVVYVPEPVEPELMYLLADRGLAFVSQACDLARMLAELGVAP